MAPSFFKKPFHVLNCPYLFSLESCLEAPLALRKRGSRVAMKWHVFVRPCELARKEGRIVLMAIMQCQTSLVPLHTSYVGGHRNSPATGLVCLRSRHFFSIPALSAFAAAPDFTAFAASVGPKAWKDSSISSKPEPTDCGELHTSVSA